MTENQKSIIIIGPAYPLRGGGMATFNERMARQLMSEGHRVIIYTFSLQYPGFLFPGKSQYSTEAAPADLDIRVRINSISPLNWLTVGNEIKKLRPDLVIVRWWIPLMGPCLGTILRRIKKTKGTEIICIADNIRPHEKRAFDTAFTKYFIKPVDRFIVMSSNVLAHLRLFSKTKPALQVHHPLYDNFGKAPLKSEARRELGLPAEKQILLFFGFIRKYKGLDILIDAMTVLKKENSLPDLLLLVAGEFYEDEAPYRAQIKSATLENSVSVRSIFIPDSDVAKYFASADAVVQPYRNATQSGVTPLAYHFEVPMIVTNVGGLPEMVPHGIAGLIAEPDAVSLASAIRQMFSSEPGRFREGMRSEKKKFSWPAFTSALISGKTPVY